MNESKQDGQQCVSRRDMLKLTGAGIGGLLLQMAAGAASASDKVDAGQQAAMLYDATRCVGCKACEAACREWNRLPLEAEPQDLTGNTWTVVKRYQDAPGSLWAFRKYQCMHCLYPACAEACPVAALRKLDWGPVVYDQSRCIGCRYCMAACPFGVPRYDWSQAFPLVSKCSFCADRENGPACAEACRSGALIFDQREELLDTARTRLAQHPGKYAESRVYGEDEIGGTSVLYLSPVPFEKIGLPKLDKVPVTKRVEWALKIVPGVIVGVGGLVSAVYWITKRRQKVKESYA